MRSVKESDWKVLRGLKDVALERFCERALEKIRAAADGAGTTHERYLRVYKVVTEEDEELAEIFDDMKRSTAFFKIVALRQTGLITDQEFAQFSAAERQAVDELLESNRSLK